MSMRMTVLMTLVFAVASHAVLCDKQYYLQGGIQTVKEYGFPGAALGQNQTSQVLPSLSNLQIMNYGSQYKIISSFFGSCDTQKQKVTYLFKDSGATSFSKTIDSSLFIRIFSNTEVILGNTGADFFFAFLQNPKQPSAITYAIYRLPGNPFQTWYGTKVVIDSTRDTNTGRWSKTGESYSVSAVCHYDSAALDSALLNSINTTSYNANHHALARLQIIKAQYDTIQPSIVITRNHPLTRTRTGHLSISDGSYLKHIEFQYAGRLSGSLILSDLEGRIIGTTGCNEGVTGVSAALFHPMSPGLYLLRSNGATIGTFVMP